MLYPFGLTGLSDQQVRQSRQQHGPNIRNHHEEKAWLASLRGIVIEPMFLLLLAAAVIYFVLQETSEGIFMTAAILLVSAISFFQDKRSRTALQALQHLTAPKAKVIRAGEILEVESSDIVIGDLIIAEEGHMVPADGRILQSADFSLNESMLTGESFSIIRNAKDEEPFAYQGTQVVSGQAILEVTAVGNQTRLGRIGGSLLSIEEEATPLQRQIERFVRRMAAIGILIFLLVWAIHWTRSGDLLDSLLKGLTLAMSILPEEIPVAFSTFMALGAYRLMKLGIIAKNTRTVETLGAATVICTDKTGTITENRMDLACLSVGTYCELSSLTGTLSPDARTLIRAAMFASESIPFDPMEKAIHAAYAEHCVQDERSAFRMVHEYPLEGKPPMMTHIFESEDPKTRIIATKGAPEAIMACCSLQDETTRHIRKAIEVLSHQGYRVLAVGQTPEGDPAVQPVKGYPAMQQDIPFRFLGLLAFLDPPKFGIREVFHIFKEAGIRIKIITGDGPVTTSAIARQSGLTAKNDGINGDALMQMTDPELDEAVTQHELFTRMFPEAKLRIIEALKRKGQIVAMTGDGVNDAPALKAAHIGIAMGKRGSELARSSASLILTDDDFSKMTEAVAMGRRIYGNLKKAIQYIISIHIPIILTVFLPLVLGWAYPNIFTPVHIIFLELIMGPTCSIIYENEPLEARSMELPPRRMTDTFLSWNELSLSLWQGIAITLGTLSTYQNAIAHGMEEASTRTLVFVCLITANIFLTFVNRSFFFSLFDTFAYKNNLLKGIVLLTLILMVGLLAIPPIRVFFGFQWPGWQMLGHAVAVGMVSVLWFEGVKWMKRQRDKKGKDSASTEIHRIPCTTK
ncbi:MAG: cation-translocating P-type ATPase [Bacteroidetes bacterium]|nr:cation-translocating P-type ATPase [Bacteroidota bacterium]